MVPTSAASATPTEGTPAISAAPVPDGETAPDAPVDAVATAIAGLCSQLLEALQAGAPGAELSHLLNVAGQLLTTEDVALTLDGTRVTANEVPCQLDTTSMLRDTLTGHGVRRVVLTRGTTARELLQLLALLVDPPSEATGAIAALWRAHGAWRIRLELAGEVSSRLLNPLARDTADVGDDRDDGAGMEPSADADGETGEQALAALWQACRADAPDFAEVATPKRLRAVVRLVGRGVSFAADQPLGIVLQRAGSPGTHELLACLAAARSAVERRRYFDAIATLQQGVPELIAVLGHPLWFVARNAAALLGEMRAHSADEPLARLLAHEDARVRVAAAEALTLLETDIAWQALEGATRDPSAVVRIAAWSGLARSPKAPPLQVLSDGLIGETDAVVQRALLACLAAHPLPMAIALLARFCARLISNPKNETIVCDALELLAEHRPNSIQPFLRRLQDVSGPATRTRLQALQRA